MSDIIFDPQPDITAYELAIIYQQGLGAPRELKLLLASLPPEVHRHLKIRSKGIVYPLRDWLAVNESKEVGWSHEPGL